MKKNTANRLSSLQNVALYIPLFIPVFLAISLLWYFFIDGVFYYCSDKVPFIDLFPPFVHGKNFGDYFIASPVVVYTLWIFLLSLMFLLPLFLLRYLTKRKVNVGVIVLASLLVPVLLFLGFFVYGLKQSSSLPPAGPPNWDSPSAVYSIKKEHENFLIHYSINSDEGDYFVGNSKVDLANYVGKKVVIKGNFPKNFSEMMANLSDMQCIKGICHKIFNPKIWEERNQNTSVINVDEISELVEASPRDKIIDYVVVNGDTLQEVAGKFSISSDTIKWANNLKTETVTPGQVLKIPPITGIVHIVRTGETIESLAVKYKTTAQKIIDFPYNQFADNKYSLIVGQTLIVPDGVKADYDIGPTGSQRPQRAV